VKDGCIIVYEPLTIDTQVILKPPPGLADGAAIVTAQAK